MWATGNGGAVGDDCSCDGYVSSIYTLSVGCISDHGLSTYFSEICPSTMAVVFTGGSHHMPGEADYKAPKIKVVSINIFSCIVTKCGSVVLEVMCGFGMSGLVQRGYFNFM